MNPEERCLICCWLEDCLDGDLVRNLMRCPWYAPEGLLAVGKHVWNGKRHESEVPEAEEPE